VYLVAVNQDVLDLLDLVDLKVKLVKLDYLENEVSPEYEEWQDHPEQQDPKVLLVGEEIVDPTV